MSSAALIFDLVRLNESGNSPIDKAIVRSMDQRARHDRGSSGPLDREPGRDGIMPAILASWAAPGRERVAGFCLKLNSTFNFNLQEQARPLA